jgi:hypothetical protein
MDTVISSLLYVGLSVIHGGFITVFSCVLEVIITCVFDDSQKQRSDSLFAFFMRF